MPSKNSNKNKYKKKNELNEYFLLFQGFISLKKSNIKKDRSRKNFEFTLNISVKIINVNLLKPRIVIKISIILFD